MGLSIANEALITSRRIPASQLLACGFVNKVFPTEDFFNTVRAHVYDIFGTHLNHDSMIRIKSLIRSSYMRELETTNVTEHYGGLARFAAGIPQQEFVCSPIIGSLYVVPANFDGLRRCWRLGRRVISYKAEDLIQSLSDESGK